jgi:hypothetical protein
MEVGRNSYYATRLNASSPCGFEPGGPQTKWTLKVVQGSRTAELRSAGSRGAEDKVVEPLLRGAILVLATRGVGGPAKGAVIMTTERNTSGRKSAHQPAKADPASRPTAADTDR